jgi:hypothetical protein
MAGRNLVPWALGSLFLIGPLAGSARAELRPEDATVSAGSSADAYVLSDGDCSWSTNASVEELLAVRATLKGGFLWARRGGKQYVVRETHTLAQARALFADLDANDPAREELAGKQARLQEERDELENQQEEIEQDLDALDDENDRRGQEAVRQGLTERQRDVDSRLARLDVREAELDSEDQAIEARQDAREARAEAQLWRLIDDSISSGSTSPLRPPTQR